MITRKCKICRSTTPERYWVGVRSKKASLFFCSWEHSEKWIRKNHPELRTK